MDMLRRIEQLEAQQRMAFASSAGGIGKRGRFAAPLQVRLAKTITPLGETYPTAPSNVFPIRFVDCDFDPADNSQTPAYTERTADVSQASALAIYEDEYIPEGTIISVFKIPALSGTNEGEWFTDWRAAGGGERDYGRVKVRNVETTDLGKGNTVRLAKSLIDPAVDYETFVTEPFLEARSHSRTSEWEASGPDHDFMHEDLRRFGVLVDDIPAGETGYAVVSGVVGARIIVNDDRHTRVRINHHDGLYSLETWEEGEGVIIWIQPGYIGSRKWGIVNLSGPPILKHGFLRATFTEKTLQYDDDPDVDTMFGGVPVLFPAVADMGNNFYAVDKYGAAGDGAGYFRASESGTYVLSVTLKSEYPELVGADYATLTYPASTFEFIDSWEATATLHQYLFRNGDYLSRPLVNVTRNGYNTVSKIVTDGSGNVTYYKNSFVSDPDFTEQSASYIFDVKKDDVFFFGIASTFDVQVRVAGNDDTQPAYVESSGDNWHVSGSFSMIQSPIMGDKSWAGGAVGNYFDFGNTGLNGGGGFTPYTQWNQSTERDDSGVHHDAYVCYVATMEEYLIFEAITLVYSGGTVVVAFNRFNSFSEARSEKVHNLGSDTLKWMLTNSSPTSSNTVKANITEISAGSGYSAGGATATQTASSQTSGKYTLKLADTTITASGGSIGPFRYAVLYNDTATNDELIGWVDYGSSITVADGGTFVLNCDATNGAMTSG